MKTIIDGILEPSFAMCILPGDLIALSFNDKGYIHIYDLQDKLIYKLGGHQWYVNQLIPFPNNKLVSGSADYTLRIWDLDTKKCVKLRGHLAKVTYVTVLDETIISGSEDKNLIIWKDGGSTVLRGHYSTISCIYAYKDYIISVCKEHSLIVWYKEKILCRFNTFPQLYCIHRLPDDQYLLAGTKLILLDISSQSITELIKNGYFTSIITLKNGSVAIQSDNIIGILV